MNKCQASHSLLQSFLQALAIMVFGIICFVGLLFCWIIWACLVYYCSWCWKLPLITYAIWIYIDTRATEPGSRRSNWFRNWSLWKYAFDYFPVKIVKTAELSSNKNYILATFPHGLLSLGAVAAFGLDHCGFSKTYPGLRSYMSVIQAPFYIPWLRELAFAMGWLPVSESCLRKTLTNPARGEAVCVMVGGIKEAMTIKKGVYKIYLKNRKGFVRMALETGASLVPVISFGEPELFDQIDTEGTWLRTVQDFIIKTSGVPPILFTSRWRVLFGMLPRKHPMHVVVGEPIEVHQSSSPSEEEINKLHGLYVESLQTLFDTEKSKYIEDPKTKLIIT